MALFLESCSVFKFVECRLCHWLVILLVLQATAGMVAATQLMIRFVMVFSHMNRSIFQSLSFPFSFLIWYFFFLIIIYSKTRLFDWLLVHSPSHVLLKPVEGACLKMLILVKPSETEVIQISGATSGRYQIAEADWSKAQWSENSF